MTPENDRTPGAGHTEGPTKSSLADTEYLTRHDELRASKLEADFLGGLDNYAQTAQTYRRSGLGEVIPVRRNRKDMPARAGFHGRDKRTPTASGHADWDRHPGEYGLVWAPGVLAVDLDAYKPEFRAFWDEFTRDLPALPPTWKTTGRVADPESGQLVFRVPEGLAWPGNLGKDSCVDLRSEFVAYSIVSPSVVVDDKAERDYVWVSPDGVVMVQPPSVDDLAELPAEWVAAIQAKRTATDTSGRRTNWEGKPPLIRAFCEVFADVQETIDAFELPYVPTGDAGDRWSLVGAGSAGGMSWGGALALAEFPVVHCRDNSDPANTEVTGHPKTMWDLVAAHLADRKTIPDATGMAGWVRVNLPEVVAGAERIRFEAMFGLDDDQDAVGVSPLEPPILPGLPKVFNPTGLGTGDDLAKVIAQAIAPVYRFAADSGQWYRRDDAVHAWTPLVGKPVEPVRGALAELIDAMPKGERPETGKDAPPLKEANYQWLRRDALDGAKRGTTAALVVDAARSSKLAIRSGALDADPSILWAGDLPFDLKRTAQRLTLADGVPLTTPHTKTAAVVPRDGVPTPLADWLLRACLDDEDRESFLNLAALSITGLSPKVIVVAYGDTDTGKTFTTGLVCRVLGNYAGEVSSKVLTNSGSEFDQHDLKGLRLGYRDEGMRDTRSGTEALKELGGAKTRIRGAKKGHDSVEFTPTHTLWLSDNKLPQVADPAVRSRVRPLAYRGDVKEVRAAVQAILGDDDGATWLATEGPGFLAELVHRAARAWTDMAGLTRVSASAAEDLERFAIEQDPFRTWLVERTDQGSTGEKTLGGELYADFKAWVADGNHYRRPGDTIPTSTAFGRLLTNDGYPSQHVTNGSVRRMKLWPSEQLRELAGSS